MASLARDLRAPFHLLRRHRDLRLLLSAGLLSLSGDWVLGVGLAHRAWVTSPPAC